ncbi:MAG: glycosyltransferase [Dysgonamonadaceae bacterium]|jgi:glycosyltransferase involved in cell wall biosynthesis|nr:glycosyltransferase [Dysgonamonadaceae bacterium]
MTDNNTRVSIAMATYNGERYLRQQLDSILRQTHSDFELVICDDCSTDSTWSILQEYLVKDPRLHCYKNEQNLGYRKNFEKAINLCQSDYIAFCDQDDIWLEYHLETLLATIGDKQLCCGKFLFIDETENLIGNAEAEHGKTLVKYAEDDHKRLKYLLYNSPFYQGASMLIHKSLVPNVFPIPGTMSHDLWIASLCSASRSFASADKVITLWRQHGNNTSYDKRLVTTNVIKITRDISYQKIRSGRESRYEQCCELLKRVPDMDIDIKNTIISAKNFYRNSDKMLFRILYTPIFLANIRDNLRRKPKWIWTLLRLARFWIYYK